MHKLKQLTLSRFSNLIQAPSPKLLLIINRLLPMIVPFNQGHRIKIKNIEQTEVQALLPFITKNKNHISTMHACAIATLGEFSAGILLLQYFPLKEYRMILKNLETEYHYQGKTSLHSVTNIPDNLCQLQKEISVNRVILVRLQTKIFDTNNKEIATTESTWQLKKWEDTHNAKTC